MKKASSTNRKKATAPAEKKLEQLELFPKNRNEIIAGKERQILCCDATRCK